MYSKLTECVGGLCPNFPYRVLGTPSHGWKTADVATIIIIICR